jgi:hypothetical protein
MPQFTHPGVAHGVFRGFFYIHVQDAALLFSVFFIIPSVQVMSSIMALAAFRKFAQDSCRVGSSMAILAGWDHLMLIAVTFGTKQFMVFAVAGHQEIESFIMAGRTAF